MVCKNATDAITLVLDGGATDCGVGVGLGVAVGISVGVDVAISVGISVGKITCVGNSGWLGSQAVNNPIINTMNMIRNSLIKTSYLLKFAVTSIDDTPKNKQGQPMMVALVDSDLWLLVIMGGVLGLGTRAMARSLIHLRDQNHPLQSYWRAWYR